MLRAFPTAVIENLQPLVDGGRYMVKRVVGDDLAVEADVFKDGHDVVAAALKWRKLGETHWHETPMAHVDTIAGAASARSMKMRSTNTPSKPGPTRSAAGSTSSRRN